MFLKVILIPLIIVIGPISLLTLLETFKIIDKKIILNDLLDSHHKIFDKINANYKDEIIFSNINDFYTLDNISPVYYPNIVIKIDKSFYYRKKK